MAARPNRQVPVSVGIGPHKTRLRSISPQMDPGEGVPFPSGLAQAALRSSGGLCHP